MGRFPVQKAARCAIVALAVVATASLAACGGGGKSSTEACIDKLVGLANDPRFLPLYTASDSDALDAMASSYGVDKCNASNASLSPEQRAELVGRVKPEVAPIIAQAFAPQDEAFSKLSSATSSIN